MSLFELLHTTYLPNTDSLAIIPPQLPPLGAAEIVVKGRRDCKEAS
jgi:hypothetical protein